ncbi:uncharacterized protein LOC126970716 [Leptidea sinapis]|uniref:uncharacterized protein LOC126970716 n=1 Tax=Leptidea sinapis TaxID=189913 RepID=UPI0021C39DE9|nr:uncharacterized protein LOC126970716 [Leptidea sinapis]
MKRKEDWKDEVRKQNVNRGLQYISRNGKVHNKKLLKPSCPTTCRKKCYEKISGETRSKIFKTFWDIGDHSRQWDFLTKYATKEIKKRITTDKENTKRLSTIAYTLPIYETDNVVIRNIPVCKTMFLNTLSISFNFLYTALEKLEKGQGAVQSDQRGKHVHHQKKITDEMKQSVLDHVASFSPVESHYIRKDSNKKYLDRSLSSPKMFRLYEEWFDSSKYTNKITNVRQCRDIINNNINISFHKPKKDVCEECHIFENNKQHTEQEAEKQAEDLKQKDLARQLKAEDKELAQQNPEILTAAYDLQKCLNVPHGNVSTFYYKRKLTVYNFTVFDLGHRQGYCFAWHQQTAKRGANEIASCVFKFIEQTVMAGIKDYRFWSDNCSGQNRNRIVFLMYMMASYKYKIKISHRFLIVGDTQNEGDSMHALIERQTKDKILYTPAQWYMAFQFAKTDDKPYKVTEVSQDIVMDFKTMLTKVNNWNFACDGSKMQWNKVTEIKIEPENPYKLCFKTSYMADSYNCIDCANKPKATRNQTVPNIDFRDLRPAYNRPIPIDKNKHKDLMDMCNKLVIPKEYHLFFSSLIKTDSNRNESDSE